MSWEVHIKSLGIYFTKGGGEEKRVGAEKERWDTIPMI